MLIDQFLQDFYKRSGRDLSHKRSVRHAMRLDVELAKWNLEKQKVIRLLATDNKTGISIDCMTTKE